MDVAALEGIVATLFQRIGNALLTCWKTDKRQRLATCSSVSFMKLVSWLPMIGVEGMLWGYWAEKGSCPVRCLPCTVN
jgi:hypothetical protein